MIKRKVFVKYETESNEQFENRLNEFLKESDPDCKEDDQTGHYCHMSDDGTTLLILFYHVSKEDPQKNKNRILIWKSFNTLNLLNQEKKINCFS